MDSKASERKPSPRPPDSKALAAYRTSFSPFARFRQRVRAAVGLAVGLLRAFRRSVPAGRLLLHDIRAVSRSGLFDRDYYCFSHPEALAGRFPSPLLDFCLRGVKARRVPDPVLDAFVSSDPEPPERNPLLVHARRFPGIVPTPETVKAIRPDLYPKRVAEEAARAARLASMLRAAPVRRARAEAAAKPPLAVVVPVHDHPELLPPLAASLLEHTPGDVLLLFVDDASRDPRVRPALRRLAAAWPRRVAVECLDQGLGFAGACNHGIRAAGRRDVILLNSDTVVSPRWSDVLRLAVYGGGRVGSASAVSNNSGFVSVPEKGFNAMPEGLSVDETARAWLHFPDIVFDCHMGHGFCLYLRREMLDEVGLFDVETFGKGYGEEVDLCLRSFHRGWLHRIVPRAFVWHLNAASFGSAGKDERTRRAGELLLARYPERPAFQNANLRGLALARPAFRETATRLAKGPRPKPRVLFVLGGTAAGGAMHAACDLASILRDSIECFLLSCRERRILLSVFRENTFEPVDERVFPDFTPLGAHVLPDADDAIVDWVLAHGIELVHVLHLFRVSAGFFRRLRDLHVPVVFSFSDYYAACPAANLLDTRGVFHPEGIADGKTVFGWTEKSHRHPMRLHPAFCETWKRRFEEDIAPFCSAFATASRDAKTRLQALLPVLRERERDFAVIPSGRTFPAFGQFAVPPRDGEPVRILVPGVFRPGRGSALVEAMAAEDGGRTVEFHVLGADGKPGAPKRAPQKGLIFHGAYRRGGFAERVQGIRPAFALVVPPWPEPRCPVVAECWAAGLPVAANDWGAPGERLREECPGGGWPLPPGAAPAEVLERLRAFAADRGGYERAVEAVRAWQNGPGLRNNARVMAARVLDLYCGLLDHSSEGAAVDAPAPFAAEKTGDLAPEDVSLLDRTDLSGTSTLRLAEFPPVRTRDNRLLQLCRLCGTRLALDFLRNRSVGWRTNGMFHHALASAADDLTKPHQPPLDGEGFPYLRARRNVPPAPWMLEERERAWAAAKAARAGRSAKTVVYTAITGGYDTLKRPEAPDGETDYVCFAASPPPGERGPWEIRPLAWKHPADPVRTARWHKLHGCDLFPDAETVIWTDGNITFKEGVEREIAEKLRAGGNPLATLRHFDRDNVSDEVESCVERDKDDAATMRAQVARYREAGLPCNAPFAETSIVAFRPSDPLARAVFATWWEELDRGSRRDQLSLPFALWKHGASFTPLFDCDIRLAEDRVHFARHDNKPGAKAPAGAKKT
jgi:GT2 family glycosyltransferase